MAKRKQRRSNKQRRHPRFGATKATGERHSRARDRKNIDFLSNEVSVLQDTVRKLKGDVEHLLTHTGQRSARGYM